MHTTLFARGLSTLGGLGLIGVVGYVNIEHAPSFDMKLVVGALAAGTALAAWVFSMMWSSRPGLAVLALLGVLAGEMFGLVATSERLLAIRDYRQSKTATENQVWVQRKEALDYAVTAAKTECTSGRGPRCMAAEAKVDHARSVLAGTTVPGDVNRLATVLGWNPVFVDMIPTLAGSIALNLLGFVMLTFGHSHRRVEKRKQELPDEPRGNVVDHPVLSALRKAGRPLTNDELADAMSVTKGEASKRRQEVQDRLIEKREGRYLMVSAR